MLQKAEGDTLSNADLGESLQKGQNGADGSTVPAIFVVAAAWSHAETAQSFRRETVNGRQTNKLQRGELSDVCIRVNRQ